MAAIRLDPQTPARVWLAVYVTLVILGGSLVYCGTLPQPAGVSEPSAQESVVEVRIRGNQRVPAEKIIPHIHTRAGRPYDPDEIEKDVRRLYQTRKFVKVNALTQPAPGGRIVIFELLERPIIEYIKITGNEQIRKKTLLKEIGLKPGDGMDPYSVEEGRRKLLDFYHSKGFSKVFIEIAEGNRPDDRGVIYVIHEGPKQRILWTRFVGNTIADDARLRTQIRSKPGFLWVFKGEVDRQQIEEDVNRLIDYYHSLGFFSVWVGRPILEFNENQDWATLTFVIDEGPRYQVRDIRLVGNKVFSTDELMQDFKLKAGEYFNRAEMTADAAMMTDLYGGEGYIFTKIEPDIRLGETPGELDLVYRIQESPRYRVGKITPQIKGDFPHTKLSTVLNRLSLRPGDIVDTRELRASERRLKASGLFRVDPAMNIAPRINIIRPDAESPPEEPELADRPRRHHVHRPITYRGQDPDAEAGQDDYPQPPPPTVDLVVEGEWIGEPGQAAQPQLPRPEGPVLPGPPPVPLPAPTGAADEPVDAGALPPGLALPPATVIRGQSPSADTAGSPGPEALPAPQPNSQLRWGVPLSRAPEESPASSQAAAQPASLGPGNPRGNSPNSPILAGNSAPARPGSLSPAPPSGTPYGTEASAAVAPPGAIAQAPPRQAWTAWSPQPPPARTTPVQYRPPEVLRGQDTYDASGGFLAPGAAPVAEPSWSPPLLSAPHATTTNTPAPASRLPPSNGNTIPGPVAEPATGPSSVAGAQGPAPNAGGGGQAFAPFDGAPGYNAYSRPETTMPPPGAAGPGPIRSQPLLDPNALLGRPPNEEPPLYVPLQPELEETQTGRFMFSVGVNSELGVVGSIVIDEQNFDWTRFPRSWEDIRNATAFRGAGQRFRFEAMPGSQVQRYTISFTEPYLLDTRVSLGLSGHYYERRFYEWDESRAGGRVALGYQFVPDLSGTLTYRGENVKVFNPIVPPGIIPELDEVVGASTLHGFRAGLTLDKRDNTFLATEGYLFDIGFEQVIGTFRYPRADLDFRKYFLLRQHPDGSGRHVLSLSSRMAITGGDTPLYDHYFAGGFSTIRGFDFRGASHRVRGLVVGGHFMLLNSIEYLFPITADDTLRGVVFCDTGTVEPSINDWTDRYRVAPGFGLRITIPAMGPAPIALDFAFPVSKEPGDDRQVFSFFVGFLR